MGRPTLCGDGAARVSCARCPGLWRHRIYVKRTKRDKSEDIDRSGCPSLRRHGSVYAAERLGCTCPDAAAAREERNTLRRARRALPPHLRPMLVPAWRARDVDRSGCPSLGTHGSAYAGRTYGCTCEDTRQARRDANARQRDRRREMFRDAQMTSRRSGSSVPVSRACPGTGRHGTVDAYYRHGCRCGPAIEARERALRLRAERKRALRDGAPKRAASRTFPTIEDCPSPLRHGTVYARREYGCACPDAIAAADRAQKAATAAAAVRRRTARLASTWTADRLTVALLADRRIEPGRCTMGERVAAVALLVERGENLEGVARWWGISRQRLDLMLGRVGRVRFESDVYGL